MYNKFKKVIKQAPVSGWSYQLEERVLGNKAFLRKFDTRLDRNNDEYRIYFKIENNCIIITRQIVVKGYKYQRELSADNPYLLEAKKILADFESEFLTKNKEVLTVF